VIHDNLWGGKLLAFGLLVKRIHLPGQLDFLLAMTWRPCREFCLRSSFYRN